MPAVHKPISRLLFVAAITALVVAPPGSPASAQSGIEVDGSAGIDGWVQSDQPFTLRIAIESAVLFDGSIEASMGGVDISTPAQVPAGTSKIYELRMPPPTGQAVRITLTDGDGEEVGSTTVSTRLPSDEVFVGVGPGLDVAGFARLVTPIVQRPVVALAIDPAETPLDLFDHLVVSTDQMAAPVDEWLVSGGTLVTDGVPDSSSGGVLSRDGVDWHVAGEGLALVVDDLSRPEAYGGLLLAGDLNTGTSDPWQSPEQALTEAASNSGRGGIPDLPWLLGSIAAYAIVVGPVNFFVLHRIGRRDYAWVTIPAISAVALAGFWVVGTERLDQVSLSHATLVMGGDRPYSRTSMVLAVGSPGEYELAFDEGSLVHPSAIGNNFDQFGRPIVVKGADVVGSTARFDLDQLGFAAASAIGAANAELPVVSPASDGSGLVIENPTDHEFWAWGVSDGSIVTAERQPLAPGGSATISPGQVAGEAAFREPGFGLNVGDAIVNELQLWNDERGWQILSPIGRAAQFSFEEIPDLFWFGFTEDLDPTVSLDGRAVDPEGTTLVIVPVDSEIGESGSEHGTLIAVGNGFVEQGGGPGDLFVSSDEMWLRFDLPLEATPTEVSFVDQFGMRPGTFELWDWETSTLDDVEVGQPVDSRFVDPVGRIVMRVGAAGAGGAQGEGFVEIPMSPRSISIGWESS